MKQDFSGDSQMYLAICHLSQQFLLNSINYDFPVNPSLRRTSSSLFVMYNNDVIFLVLFQASRSL